MIVYTKYKNSDIDWIREIPNEWSVFRLKEIANVETGNTPSMNNPDFYSDEGMPWIKPDDLRDFQEIFDSDERLSDSGIKEARVIRKGAVLVCCIGTVGKIGIAGCSLATNQQINSVELKQIRVLDGYGKYLLYSAEQEFIRQANKVVVAILNKVKQSQIKFAIPSIQEQQQITNYLDYQIPQIDKLISNKKEQIEKLKELRQIEINNAVTKGLNPNVKYKDSGIDWLGKIPEHWKLTRLKNIASHYSIKSDEITEDDFVVALENIESETGKYVTAESEYENKGNLFKKEHILYNKLRPYLCKVYQAEQDGISVGDIIIIECKKILLPSFLKFRMLSQGFTSVVNSSAFGAKMPRTSWEIISNLKIGLPENSEQMRISEYLINKTSKIDKLIKNIEEQILKLQELRKIKIYQAVTGNMKITANECTA